MLPTLVKPWTVELQESRFLKEAPASSLLVTLSVVFRAKPIKAEVTLSRSCVPGLL